MSTTADEGVDSYPTEGRLVLKHNTVNSYVGRAESPAKKNVRSRHLITENRLKNTHNSNIKRVSAEDGGITERALGLPGLYALHSHLTITPKGDCLRTEPMGTIPVGKG